MLKSYLVPEGIEVARWFERAPGGPWFVVCAEAIYAETGERIGVRRVELFCPYPAVVNFDGFRIDRIAPI